MKTVNIADIRINGGTQSRAAINRDTVADYAEAMEAGAEFPPVIVFYDGSAYWLADGFHRYEAYARAKVHDVPADVRQGTQRDAILYSVGANASHGLRRTNEDKQRAVQVLLNDPEWSKWSDREIARQCHVGHQMVGRLRSEQETVTGRATSEERTFTTKHGTTSTMNTANIGGGAKPDQVRMAPDDVEDLDPVDPAASSPEPEPETSMSEPEDPATAKVRRELAKLTREALEDEVIGLRADLSEAKKTARKQADEIRVLKAHIKGFEGDQADTIRRQAKIIAHKESEMFRANQKADRALAKAKRLENQLKEMGATEIALD